MKKLMLTLTIAMFVSMGGLMAQTAPADGHKEKKEIKTEKRQTIAAKEAKIF